MRVAIARTVRVVVVIDKMIVGKMWKFWLYDRMMKCDGMMRRKVKKLTVGRPTLIVPRNLNGVVVTKLGGYPPPYVEHSLTRRSQQPVISYETGRGVVRRNTRVSTNLLLIFYVSQQKGLQLGGTINLYIKVT